LHVNLKLAALIDITSQPAFLERIILGQVIDFGDGSKTPAERPRPAGATGATGHRPPGPPPKGATNRAAVRDHAVRRPGGITRGASMTGRSEKRERGGKFSDPA
jgi:hypothetical protein